MCKKVTAREYEIKDSTSVTNLEDKLTLLTSMIANGLMVYRSYYLQVNLD